MKAFEISGGNGSYLQLEDGRFADTVSGDTSEKGDAHDVLEELRKEVTHHITQPIYGDFNEQEFEEYVGA